MFEKKRGRPPVSESTSGRMARGDQFDKLLCVFCQEDTPDEVHEVTSKNMGLHIKEIGEKSNNDTIRTRLSNVVASLDPLQAVADDVKYHLSCLMKQKRIVIKSANSDQDVKFGEIWSDLAIIDVINQEINDESCKILNMNDTNTTYVKILQEHGCTKEVLPEKETHDIIERDSIGQQLFEKFTDERLKTGKVCVWDRLAKANLKTYKSKNASKAILFVDKVVKVKEERGLLQRFIIAARSRPDLDLKECIGKYEFGIIPRSLFASDGSVLLAYDKSKVQHQLEAMGSLKTDEANMDVSSHTRMMNPTPRNKVLIIDGMALVHAIQKTTTMLTCKDFADAFVQKLIVTSESYNEIRLVFDRYIEQSLKAKMRKKRTGGKEKYYHISDATSIRNISLKDLFAHVNTKAELTEYLANKALEEARSSDKLKKFMITSDTTTKGNTTIPSALQNHSQEEADTIMLLHASQVDKDSEVVIQSPDTDVLLLMIQHFSCLPQNISFLTGKAKDMQLISIALIVKQLGKKKS